MSVKTTPGTGGPGLSPFSGAFRLHRVNWLSDPLNDIGGFRPVQEVTSGQTIETLKIRQQKEWSGSDPSSGISASVGPKIWTSSLGSGCCWSMNIPTGLSGTDLMKYWTWCRPKKNTKKEVSLTRRLELGLD